MRVVHTAFRALRRVCADMVKHTRGFLVFKAKKLRCASTLTKQLKSHREQQQKCFHSTNCKRPCMLLTYFGTGCGLQVYAAPVKTLGRMREKLGEYSGAGVEWPLASQILDPVRCSVVCAGAAEMLDVVLASVHTFLNFLGRACSHSSCLIVLCVIVYLVGM